MRRMRRISTGGEGWVQDEKDEKYENYEKDDKYETDK